MPDMTPPPPYGYAAGGNLHSQPMASADEKNQNQFNIPPDNFNMDSPTSSNDSPPSKNLNTNDNSKVNWKFHHGDFSWFLWILSFLVNFLKFTQL